LSLPFRLPFENVMCISVFLCMLHASPIASFN
jgi:hypothetical protein